MNDALQSCPAKQAQSRMKALRNELKKLGAALGDSAVYDASQKNHLQKLLADKAALDKQLATTEERWLELSEEIEQATNSD